MPSRKPRPSATASEICGFCTVASCFPSPVNFGSVPKGTPLETDGLLFNGGTGAPALSVATIKAVLVAMIFMHLKWDWGRLYFLIIPTFVLAPMFILALLPDIVIYWKNFYGK